MLTPAFMRSVLGRSSSRKPVIVQMSPDGRSYRFLLTLDRARRREEGIVHFIDYLWPLGGFSPRISFKGGKDLFLRDLVYDAQVVFMDQAINAVTVYVPKREVGFWRVEMDQAEYDRIVDLVKAPAVIPPSSP
jgi:hypothetical protein